MQTSEGTELHRIIRGEVEHAVEEAREVHVHMWLDVSGSMASSDGGADSRLAAAKAGINSLLGVMPAATTVVSLTAFNHEIMPLVQAQRVAERTRPGGLNSRMAKLEAAGGTSLYDAAYKAVVAAKAAHDAAMSAARAAAIAAGSPQNDTVLQGKVPVQILVILTDGEDQHSLHSIEEAIEKLQKPQMPTLRIFLMAVGEATADGSCLRRIADEVKPAQLVSAAKAADVAGAFSIVSKRIVKIAVTKKEITMLHK